ncbi:hypothetical protein K8M07_10375 [Schnuerera sp. xch1]|uniref:DUF6994 family protein n=1 Tax=Schnuerera sp. xch1 TaxID=2874283 RepID=UPI001CBEBA09|nr:hypothetical protein [Schnuerera sp. xch1]MBZ2175641.1 hypothetical protein [Schnuerera sp. xch1]
MIEEYVRFVLFKDEKPIIYDMKDEYKSLLYLIESDTNIEKWKKYKKYKSPHDNDSIDCDVCELALYVYYKVWGFLKGKKVNGDRPTRQYNEIPYYVRNHKYQLVINHDEKKEYYRGDTMTSFTNTYNHYEKHFESNEKIKEQIEKNAKLHHTIGNMIPVPSYFNSERSGKYARYDFWDLTMQQIKKWYKCPDDNEPLKQLLNPNRENKEEKTSIELCKHWLRYFTDWNNFVEKNYLQDFMQLSDDGELMKDEDGDYISMDFWSNHSYEDFDLPLEPETFYDYLRILNLIIEKRNGRILVELYENLKIKPQR